MSFFAELKRRNVIRMAGLYVVGAWLIIQIAETLLPAFDVPGWVLRATIILLGIGFLPALVFSWVFELTPEGLKRDGDFATDPSLSASTARRMDLLTLSGVLLVAALIAADRYWPRAAEGPVAAPDKSIPEGSADSAFAPDAKLIAATTQMTAAKNSIAVLPFINMSSDPEQEYFSDGISEEILNELARTPELQVAARTSSFSFKGGKLEVPAIARELSVRVVLEGSVLSAILSELSPALESKQP